MVRRPTSPKPTILSNGMITGALKNPRFYVLFPEFRVLHGRVQEVNKKLAKPRGCSSCKKRRLAKNFYKEFVSILQRLGPERQEALKKFFNVKGLMYNTVKPGTHQLRINTL